jgi:murein DD-endopeptidase MepM/ murein hydrolase activator NlpD
LTFGSRFWYTAEQISTIVGDFFIMMTLWEWLIKKRSVPLLLKELAFRAIAFVARCGESHPISFALRPAMMRKDLRLLVGVNLAVIAVMAAIFGPIPSMAENIGGPLALTMITEGEVQLVTEERVAYPLPSPGVLTQKFWLLHSGIDLATPVGTPVNPVMAGIVDETQIGRFGYGNNVVVTHKNGYSSRYAHLSKILVRAGDVVTTNTILGESGNTGRSTGPHLHLEIHLDGKAINPAAILGIR